MVEAAPASPFEVAEPNLLFEFLIIAFDTPVRWSRLSGQDFRFDRWRICRG
jgi:hypothetical protein